MKGKFKTIMFYILVILIIFATKTVFAVVNPINEKEPWTGKRKNSKALVLLIEFNDYKFENMKNEETPRAFVDWSKKHYEDMIFKDKLYKGPKKEELFTMKQYYKEQSGDSFELNGAVSGWYTAKNNASYYGKPLRKDKDSNVESLVKEAFEAACKDSSINLSDFDLEDPMDKDDDGNFHETDGIIDNLIVIHAGKGEEVGGGTLGENAIWSNRNSVSDMISYNLKDVHGNNIGIHDYMIVPQDAGVGVLAHEFGHMLGLPDEYNVANNENAPVGYWSIMASGSGGGISFGLNPTGFSPWCKQYLQEKLGGNWININRIKLEDINEKGIDILLDEASLKGDSTEAVRIDLPKDNFSDKDKYYLLEWRNSVKTDNGLQYCEGGDLKYDPGLLIWYVDENYLEVDREGHLTGNIDNDVKKHPGYGFIGVVDSDQNLVSWKNEISNEFVENGLADYQIHDATFGLRKDQNINVSNLKNKKGLVLEDNYNFMNPVFDDSRDYKNKGKEEAGRILENHGLKVYVTGESKDRSVGRIHISKTNNKRKEFKNATSNFIENISIDKNIVDENKSKLQIATNIKNPKNEAVIGYLCSENGKIIEKHVELKLIDGKYVGYIEKNSNFNIGKYRVEYIVIEDKDDNVEIIYNGNTTDISGLNANIENLDSGNFIIASKDNNGIKVENLNKRDTLVLGQMESLKFGILNENFKPQTVDLIVGVYDENNKLVKSISKTEKINFNESKKIELVLDLKKDIDINKEHTVKVFLWDSLDMMNSLMKTIKFKTISISDLEKTELNKFRNAESGNEINKLLNDKNNKLNLNLLEYLNLKSQLKYSVCIKIYEKKNEIVTKQSLENLMQKSIMESKLEKYSKAKNSIDIENNLNDEPNLLGLNVENYKKLQPDMKRIVAGDIILLKEKFIDRKSIQKILDESVEKTFNMQNVIKKMKEFNDYMYDIWTIDEKNIGYSETLLKELNNCLKKLDIETKERFEKNKEYIINKERIEKTRVFLNEKNDELEKLKKAECVNEIIELLNSEKNILKIKLEDYKKLSEENKYIVAKEILNNRLEIKSKEDIEKIILNTLEKIKTQSLEDEILKFVNAKKFEEIKKLLDENPNKLGLDVKAYLNLNYDNKVYISKELLKNKKNLINKEIIQKNLDELILDVNLYDLEEIYIESLGLEDTKVINELQNIWVDVKELLKKLDEDSKRKILKKYKSYDEINKEMLKHSATVDNFTKAVKDLQKFITFGEIDEENGINKARDMVKECDDILKILKEIGEYEKISSRTVNEFKEMKSFVEEYN